MKTKQENTALIQTLLHMLGDVVHQFQRERGCAGLYLDSLGKIFAPQLKEQVSVVTTTIQNLKEYCEQESLKNALPSNFEGRLNFLFLKYDNLNIHRDEIAAISVRYTQALNVYTFNIILPTIDAMIELSQREVSHNSALVSAYSNFLQWKEKVGLERALGSRGFHTYSFRNQEFCDRFVSLIAEQKNYLDSFKNLASPSQIALLNDHIDDNDLNEFEQINQLMEEGAHPSEVERYSGQAWFDLLTRLIDSLRIVEKGLVTGLPGVQDSALPTAVTADGRKRANIGSRIETYRKFLKSLPMFAALSDTEFDELMSFAQIREYEKDKLLCFKDEPATRLYIILEGWAKSYNGLENGDEAILQMMGSGETLLETSVFLNVPTPVNVQIVEKALLLSIPAPVIRQRIQSSPQLAVNMINTVSLRSQRLVQQLELSRLKSAQERVGWFLLRLVLNQKPKNNIIFLPYEKSVIASYLDMRPETFSRTLQKFKLDGFEIASDRVNMPDYQALCNFCDAELAGQCKRVETPECPRPEFADLVFHKSN